MKCQRGGNLKAGGKGSGQQKTAAERTWTMGKNLKGKELGEGLSQRRDGRYMARYKGKSRYADTEREARAAYRQLVQDVESHAFVNKSALTLDEYFKEWLAGRYDLKGSTKANYKTWYNILTGKRKWQHGDKPKKKPLDGGRKVQSLEKRDITAAQAALIANDNKPETVNCVMGLLKQLMKQAVQDGIIAITPCYGIKTVKGKREERASNTIHRALTREEQAAFMEAAKGEWLYNMIDFMLRTGVRSGEARGLRWRDIDHRKRQIHIRNNRTWDENRREIDGSPKTETSTRDIPLTPEIKTVLDRQRQQLRDMFGNIQGFNDPVFKSVQGNIVTKSSLKTAFDRTLSRMEASGHGIEPITPHALRDTFATRAIEAGMNPQTLKTLLGHSSLSMTMDLYAHVLPDTKREEMEKIAAAF